MARFLRPTSPGCASRRLQNPFCSILYFTSRAGPIHLLRRVLFELAWSENIEQFSNVSVTLEAKGRLNEVAVQEGVLKS